jgi:RNA polymerase sigma factor (sigma-70 family)
MTSAVEGPNGLDTGPDVVVELQVHEGFDTFYRREMPALVAFARSLSGSAWADDIAQDAMLSAYRRWDAVSRMDVPAAWVRRACANRAVSTLRRRAVEARGLARLRAQRPAGEPLPEEYEAFWAEVRRLPRRQAQAIALQYVYDLGVAEIALTLGMAEGTVKSHLFRGRAALAAALRRIAEEDV